jgi:SAM-dependent methyltransferase
MMTAMEGHPVVARLRCPVHASAELVLAARHDRAVMRCTECGCDYTSHGEVLDFAPKSATDVFHTESRQWDGQAEHYEERRAADPVYMAGVQAALAAAGPLEGLTVLDAGCGTGLLTRALAHASATVAALDASAASLELVRPDAEGNRIVTVRGDLMHLPFASESFDCVVCANALQQIPGRDNQERVVAELARVTRPGGRVVVTVHAYSVRKRWLGWAQEGSANGHSGPVQFIRRFRVGEFKEVLRSSLEVERVTGAAYPLPYRFKLSPLSRVAEALLSRVPVAAPLGEMLVGHCVRR